MADESQPSAELSGVLAKTLLLGPPASLFVAAINDIDTTPLDGFAEHLLYWYSLFLFGYMLLALWLEYVGQPNLHREKPLWIDLAVLISLSWPLHRLAPAAAGELSGYLFWLALFLAGSCAWELATLWYGYGTYFERGRARTLGSFWSTLVRRERRGDNLADVKHLRWMEYRYWIFLDGGALALLLVAKTLLDYCAPWVYVPVLKFAMAVVGFAIGCYNLLRMWRLEKANKEGWASLRRLRMR